MQSLVFGLTEGNSHNQLRKGPINTRSSSREEEKRVPFLFCGLFSRGTLPHSPYVVGRYFDPLLLAPANAEAASVLRFGFVDGTTLEHDWTTASLESIPLSVRLLFGCLNDHLLVASRLTLRGNVAGWTCKSA